MDQHAIAPGNEALRAMWITGDFGAFSAYTSAGDDKVFRQARIQAGERVLDAACGAGPFALRAAQIGADVVGIDIAPNLIAQARESARAAGQSIRFDEGDVESLPYGDASFDTVVSQFGVIFTPRPGAAVAEMARVLKPDGRFILFCWTPTSWVGRLMQVVGRHMPPPPNGMSPLSWGIEEVAKGYLGTHFMTFNASCDAYAMQFPFGSEATMDFFLQNMGPVSQAYNALQAMGKAQALREDLGQLFSESNQGRPDAWQVESEYLQIEARKR